MLDGIIDGLTARTPQPGQPGHDIDAITARTGQPGQPGQDIDAITARTGGKTLRGTKHRAGRKIQRTRLIELLDSEI